MKIPFLIAILFLSVTICRAQYVKLGLNLTKGQTYYNTTTATATVEQTVNGQKTTVVTTNNGRIAFKVMGIRDSLYDLEMRYENLSLKMQLPTASISYSSDKIDPSDYVSAMMTAFKNQPINLVISRSGDIKSLKGMDAIIEGITNKYPALDAGQKAQIKSMLDQSFGERAFRSNFEMGMAIYPSVPVRKGAIWVINSQLRSARPANVHTIYDLRDITEGFYQIHMNATIDYLNKDKFEENGGKAVKYDLTGDMTGDIVVDKITGWIKQSSITQNIVGTTQIKNSSPTPGMTLPMIIPINMKSEVVITGNN